MCLFTSARTAAIVFARSAGSEAMYCAGVVTFDAGFMDLLSFRSERSVIVYLNTSVLYEQGKVVNQKLCFSRAITNQLKISTLSLKLETSAEDFNIKPEVGNFS